MSAPAILTPCPKCGGWLHGFGRYCGRCDRHLIPEANESSKPAAAIPDTRSEAEIEAAIIADLRKLGFNVAKLSQRRATQQTEGVSDLVVFGFGAIVFAEIKTAKGAQSDEQWTFMTWVRANGGRYEVWRSEADALAFVASVTGRTQSEVGTHG